MIDLSTTYLGFKLDNPLVPSSSPLTGNMDDVKRLEDAGASALVLPSLFEEVVHHEQKQLEQYVHLQALGHSEAESYRPVPDNYAGELDNYLQHIQKLKSDLDIPVIASLNGISSTGWIDFGKDMQQAGADALELNVYYVAADPKQTGEEVENRYLQLLAELREQINIPISMKLSSQFSSIANMVGKLQLAGAAGAVLFNRFYQPDIDLETLKIKPHIELSNPMEALLRIRWIALLRGRVDLSLAATGGFHDIDAILKALLAGADAVYLCSVLLEKGSAYYAELLQQLKQWLEEHEYESVSQMKASVSQECAIDPATFEHNNYFDVIKSYKK
ncbi:MAG: dihydroorotate dehydrogenase-like protein [Desulfobulbaceae bacterium]|nr:dihydroorotate dehydrogenase-like protein [Desulfobulbaceae bacterium]